MGWGHPVPCRILSSICGLDPLDASPLLSCRNPKMPSGVAACPLPPAWGRCLLPKGERFKGSPMAPPCPELEGRSSSFSTVGSEEASEPGPNPRPNVVVIQAITLSFRKQPTVHLHCPPDRGAPRKWTAVVSELFNGPRGISGAIGRPTIMGHWMRGQEEWPLPPQEVLLLERKEFVSEKGERWCR